MIFHYEVFEVRQRLRNRHKRNQSKSSLIYAHDKESRLQVTLSSVQRCIQLQDLVNLFYIRGWFVDRFVPEWHHKLAFNRLVKESE